MTPIFTHIWLELPPPFWYTVATFYSTLLELCTDWSKLSADFVKIFSIVKRNINKTDLRLFCREKCWKNFFWEVFVRIGNRLWLNQQKTIRIFYSAPILSLNFLKYPLTDIRTCSKTIANLKCAQIVCEIWKFQGLSRTIRTFWVRFLPFRLLTIQKVSFQYSACFSTREMDETAQNIQNRTWKSQKKFKFSDWYRFGCKFWCFFIR